MSDLIDFDSPTGGTKSPGATRMLAAPLIPSPEAGPSVFIEARRSIENNPFDMVHKKITDYERNKGDPFESVVEKAMGRMSIEPIKDDFVPKRTRASMMKHNKTLDETESKPDSPLCTGVDDISIITDLNDTNLISDNVAGEKVGSVDWGCDKKVIPYLNVSHVSCDADLSILNQSAMNDSLLDDQLTKEPSISLSVRPRSMSQCNFLSPELLVPRTNTRRSMSVTDAPKVGNSNVDVSVASAQSSLFEDPLNNAFRNSIKSSISSNASFINSQFDFPSGKQRTERLNSDSSVFSVLSNVSAITTDLMSKVRQDRFCSESSNYSNISNLSVIPNNTVMSSDSSVFMNDNTMNKGFITSRSQLSSTSSVALHKTPSEADTSDSIKKFYQIKPGMSSSQTESRNSNNSLSCKKSHSSSGSEETLPRDNSSQKIEEKLIDVSNDSPTDSMDQSGIDDIISHEAKTLAETFEKMASSKSSNTTEDDFLFSKTQLNFDDLPLSDDEAVDNLIELSGGESGIKESPEVVAKSNVSWKDEVKALEHEFLDNKDPDKKTTAATLLLDLEKFVKEQDNPDACKVLADLQKMLGVECENNTEILQACLQNSMLPENEKKIKTDVNSSRSITDNDDENSELTSKTEKITEIKSNNSSNDIADMNFENESKEAISDNFFAQCNIKKEPKERSNDDVTPENQKLALSLLQALNNIVNKNEEDSAIDVLNSLGAVLNMASELRKEHKNKKVPEEEKIRGPKSPKKLIRSVSSLYRSPSKTNIALKKKQNTSFETLPLRKSISVNPAYNNSKNNLLDIPPAAKRKSHLLSLKKRFPSDPGFTDAADKKKAEAKPTLGASKPAIEPIKAKLKKKLTGDVVNKKGPMKAIMPLGSMQKQGVERESHEMGSVTPPPKAHSSTPAVKIVSSTPNNSVGSKSKPTASSTPNSNTAKTQRVKPSPQNSSKSKITTNLSPVSLNSSSKVNTSRRSEHNVSPPKRPMTPRKSETTESTRLPRYSPRPVRIRNHSFSDMKTAKSPQPASGVLKVGSEKTQRHSSVLSPLRNSNKLPAKPRPMSLMPKLSKLFGSKSGPEKENYA